MVEEMDFVEMLSSSTEQSEAVWRSGLLGCDLPEQEKGVVPEEKGLRCLKMARNEAKASPFLERSNFQPLPFDGHLMLFPSLKQDASILCDGGRYPYCNSPSPLPFTSGDAYDRNAGLVSGSLYGALAGFRGPFSPSQWMELEQQVMIYKYIGANIPIPSIMLNSIKICYNQAVHSGYSSGSLRPNAFGWEQSQVATSDGKDSEPGRCRRTDGKKWRCSKNAAPNHKYCEKHMNRGRHRSRKPVEGQTGHAKTLHRTASLPGTSTVSGNRSVCSPNAPQGQQKLHPGSTETSATQFNRVCVNKNNQKGPIADTESLSMNQTSKNFLNPDPKNSNPFEASSCSLMPNPSRDSYSDNRSFASEIKSHESQTQPHHQSMGNPSEVEDTQSDHTQLSITIPVASSDLSSSSSSPTQENPNHSANLYPIQMGLGVNQKQTSWMPTPWEASIGGPLGEVLAKTYYMECMKDNSSTQNFTIDGTESSPPLASSPTGVLQATTFGSLPSSSRSSPRPENFKVDDLDLVGSAFLNTAYDYSTFL